MKIEDLSGYTYYKDKEYMFTLSNYELRLLPKESSQLITYKINSVLKSHPNKNTFISDAILEGLCINGERIFICIQDHPMLIDGIITHMVKWIYIHNSDITNIKISGINFLSQEINYIYNANRYISCDYELEDNHFKNYTMTINSKKRELLGTFEYGKNKIEVFGDMAWKKNFDVSNNLEIWSKISLEFKEDVDDLNLIYKLILLQTMVVDFLTYRTNNSFDSIEVYSYEDENKRNTIGKFYISDDFGKENNLKDVQRLVNVDNIPNIGLLYELINKNKIYTSHICGSLKLRSIYNSPRILGVLIAFERIKNWKYKNDNLRNEDYLKLVDRMNKFVLDNKDKLCDGLSGRKIKFKNTVKSIIKPQIPFSAYIKKAIDDYPIALSLIRTIYQNDKPKELINNIANRLNDLRNNMAHGNMDIVLTENTTKDIKFMELFVYAIILSELNIKEKEVACKIAYLFNIKSFILNTTN